MKNSLKTHLFYIKISFFLTVRPSLSLQGTVRLKIVLQQRAKDVSNSRVLSSNSQAKLILSTNERPSSHQQASIGGIMGP
jgi:hypothetical protein